MLATNVSQKRHDGFICWKIENFNCWKIITQWNNAFNKNKEIIEWNCTKKLLNDLQTSEINKLVKPKVVNSKPTTIEYSSKNKVEHCKI